MNQLTNQMPIGDKPQVHELTSLAIDQLQCWSRKPPGRAGRRLSHGGMQRGAVDAVDALESPYHRREKTCILQKCSAFMPEAMRIVVPPLPLENPIPQVSI